MLSEKDFMAIKDEFDELVECDEIETQSELSEKLNDWIIDPNINILNYLISRSGKLDPDTNEHFTKDVNDDFKLNYYGCNFERLNIFTCLYDNKNMRLSIRYSIKDFYGEIINVLTTPTQKCISSELIGATLYACKFAENIMENYDIYLESESETKGKTLEEKAMIFSTSEFYNYFISNAILYFTGFVKDEFSKPSQHVNMCVSYVLNFATTCYFITLMKLMNDLFESNSDMVKVMPVWFKGFDIRETDDFFRCTYIDKFCTTKNYRFISPGYSFTINVIKAKKYLSNILKVTNKSNNLKSIKKTFAKTKLSKYLSTENFVYNFYTTRDFGTLNLTDEQIDNCKNFADNCKMSIKNYKDIMNTVKTEFGESFFKEYSNSFIVKMVGYMSVLFETIESENSKAFKMFVKHNKPVDVDDADIFVENMEKFEKSLTIDEFGNFVNAMTSYVEEELPHALFITLGELMQA